MDFHPPREGAMKTKKQWARVWFKGRRENHMKKFNTTAVCVPAKHYMVDLSERVKEIKQLVDEGKYFTINRARQYGKAGC